MTAFRVDLRAGALRRAVGPAAWFVLEELLMLGEPAEDGDLVAAASVRRIGVAVSLNKDTVARAITALAVAGVVAPIRQASAGGRFGAGSYRVRVPEGVRLDLAGGEPPPPSARRKPPKRHRHAPAQLALLGQVESSVSGGNGEDPGDPQPLDALAPAVPAPPSHAARDANGNPAGGAKRC